MGLGELAVAVGNVLLDWRQFNMWINLLSFQKEAAHEFYICFYVLGARSPSQS